jgi:hypothetical protein
MLEKLLRLYVMGMAWNVRSPMVHLVGPPGCGKSTFAEQLAELLGVELHLINVSRLSPLETEGVLMPHGSGEEMILKMLPATYWSSLKEGDIILFDEFLRAFPEVYNGLLDIFTSRRVGALRLPKVFMMAASNSVTTYDNALEDRLLHVMVPDPRKSKIEKDRIARILIDEVGLMPDMAITSEMDAVLNDCILPTYDLLDTFSKKGQKTGKSREGNSLRNLIGQAQLKYVTSAELKDLISTNNHRAMQAGKVQFVVLLDGKKSVPHGYEAQAQRIRGNPRLSPIQTLNLELNLQLIEMERAKTSEEDEA